jgi:hypothetical protein
MIYILCSVHSVTNLMDFEIIRYIKGYEYISKFLYITITMVSQSHKIIHVFFTFVHLAPFFNMDSQKYTVENRLQNLLGQNVTPDSALHEKSCGNSLRSLFSFDCINWHGKLNKNYKVIIVQYSDPFLFSTSTNAHCNKLICLLKHKSFPPSPCL